ncbi:50S ribosomal protein L29 [Methylovulum psychrotolerans]|jgi:large subunit ribosomal protein L29|uniref:Large ribosomal subunit protein uL29 n=1 Tax=Methylovulum psychrotolerans TaxID=1704499 RepID=A0A1Z4BW90_9GAMM|nr:50S ribosomal protein L29 [Methylovulum psychrotolerans]ASF45510.1 50S ribosomal protein L29 [Methylovulum psychrotolerans]MBT9098458.1 50S ribosomal protein L29 [Methylovulum psychrotolerans]POZ52954.1 50S ribosomal protein L29 [Methylovulum psychrotolerans]
MKATELRQKTQAELQAMLLELSRERFNLRMQKATGQLSKSDQVRKVRRDIARIQTVLTQMVGA